MKNTLYNRIRPFIYRLANQSTPVLFNQIQHYRLHRKFGQHAYWANIKDPKTFNEKILHLKVYGDYGGYERYVDKEMVKQYVASVIGESYVIPTYAVFSESKDFDPDALRFPCILKPTHASSRVIILNNKNDVNTNQLRNTMKKWLQGNLYDTSGEKQYKNLTPKVIAEQLLVPTNGELLDYKFFCFDGEPHLIQVDIGRRVNHTRAIYDTNWVKQPFTIKYPLYEGEVPKPNVLTEMLELARKLSAGFSFARVDLYHFDNKIYFGELTFHHESGYGPFSTYEDDLQVGNLLILS